MSNLIDKQTNASLCGLATMVCEALPKNLTENADGSVTVKAGTQGNNENTVMVIVRAKEAAAKQLQASQKSAVEKGKSVFRFQVSGPVEVDLDTNKLGAENKPLILNVAATMARAVHPNEKVDPLQNTALLTARVVVTNFKNGNSGLSLQFGHLTSEVDEAMAPAAVKLSAASEKLLAAYADQDVMVAGTFTRQTAEEARDGYNPYDHVSFTVDSAQLIQISAGKTRYQKGLKQKPQDLVVSDYETGYESDADAQTDTKKDLSDLDF